MTTPSVLPAAPIKVSALRSASTQVRLLDTLTRLDGELRTLLAGQPSFDSMAQEAWAMTFSRAPLMSQCFVWRELKELGDSVNELREVMQAPRVTDELHERMRLGRPQTYAATATQLLDTQGEAIADLDMAAFENFINRLGGDAAGHYRQALDRYWSAPRAPSSAQTRQARLLEIRREQLQAEVDLLYADETLAAPNKSLAEQVLMYPSAAVRKALPVSLRPALYEVALQVGERRMPVAGAFIITERDGNAVKDISGVYSIAQTTVASDLAPEADTGAALLYSPGRGLEEFDSLKALDEALKRRWQAASEFEFVFQSLARADVARVQALAAPALRYRELAEDVFEQTWQTLRATQLANLSHALEQAHSDPDADWEQALTQAVAMEHTLQGRDVLAAREQKRLAKGLAGWLKGASAEDRDQWLNAVADYREQVQGTELQGLPSLAQFGDRALLLAYARQEVMPYVQLHYGVQIDPDKVLITTTKAYQTGPLIPPGASAYSTAMSLDRTGPTLTLVHNTRSLTALLLENVGALDIDYALTARISGDAKGLSSAEVKDIVRALNIGQSYERFLRERLLHGPQAQADQERFAALMAAQLRVDLLEAKISGAFAHDRQARGFGWVNSVLEHPVDDDRRLAVEGHRIQVQQLLVQGATLLDVLVFAPTAVQSVPSLVIYTPQAPGGVRFREYESRAALVAGLLSDSHLRDYFVSRAALTARPEVARLLQRGVRGTELALQPIKGDFLHQAYAAQVERLLADVDAQSTTTGESDRDTSLDVLEAVLDVVSSALPLKILAPLALGRSLLAVWNGIDALRREQYEEAQGQFLRVITHFADLASDAAQPPTGRVRRPTVLNPQFAVGKKPEPLTLRSDGVYENLPAQGGFARYFIEDAGRWFQLQRDDLTWRLVDMRRPGAYYKRPVARQADGTWRYADAPGLKGGGKSFIAPTRLQVAFPRFSLKEARVYLDQFRFPEARQRRMELDLAEDLIRTRGTLPDWAKPYFHGHVSQPQPSTSAGPSKRPALPAVVTPPKRPRPDTGQDWTTWGQVLEGRDLNRVSDLETAMPVYRVVSKDGIYPAIEIDGSYYEILPDGPSPRAGSVFLKPPSWAGDDLQGVWQKVALDPSDQPRLVTFKAGVGWKVALPLFHKPLHRFIDDLYPNLTTQSLWVLAERLFQVADAESVGELTATRLLNTSYTLHAWRAKTAAPVASMSDPLTLLAEARLLSGRTHSISSESRLDTFRRLNFRLDEEDIKAQGYLPMGDIGFTDRILSRNGYQLQAGVTDLNMMMFTRPGSQTVYLMLFRDIIGRGLYVPIVGRWVEAFVEKCRNPDAVQRLRTAQSEGRVAKFMVGVQTVEEPVFFVVRVDDSLS